MDAGTPALTRGLAVLRMLSASREGATAAELAAVVGAPRATLYRLLRTLAADRFVASAPGAGGRYVLGPACAELAARAAGSRDLATVARPAMESLAAALGETVKLVVREGLETVSVAVVIPRRDSCIASQVGTRLPLHVGASQRLLLAHAPADVRAAVLAGPLPRVASRTVTSRARLAHDVAALATRRHVASHGEGVEGVGATAALVGPQDAEPRGSLVAVYIHASQSARSLALIRRRTVAAADAITRALSG